MAGGKLAGVAESKSWGKVIRRLVLHLVCIPLIALVLGAVTYNVAGSFPRYGTGQQDSVTMEELKGKNVLWVDARTRTDYDLGHQRGAILLNEDEWSSLLPAFISQWKDQTVVIYCAADCSASRAVARRLQTELEVPGILILEGGWDAVKESGNVQYLGR